MNKASEIYNLIDENGAHLSTLVLETQMSNQHIWGYAGRGISSFILKFKILLKLIENGLKRFQKHKKTFLAKFLIKKNHIIS